MVIRRLSTVLAVLAVGAAGGMIGTSLAADAGTPKASLTDKVFYAKANPAFTSNLTTNVNVPKTLLAVTVHAPSAGQVDIVINSQLWTDFPATSGTELENVLTVARCAAPNTLSTNQPAGCANESTYWFHKPPNSGEDDSTFAYSIQGQLTFPSAGTRVYYINASADAFPGGLWGNDGAHVQVAFTPKSPISNSSVVTVSAALPGGS